MNRKILLTGGVLIAAIITTIIALLIMNRMQPEIIIMLSVFALMVISVALIKTQYSQRRRQILVVIGIIEIFSGLIMAIGLSANEPDPTLQIFNAMFIIMGMILVTRGFTGNRTADDYRIQDERSIRIGTYGLSYSWYLTFMTVAAIGWLTGTEMTTISGPQICLILIILMPVSARFFQWYFNTRGDVW